MASTSIANLITQVRNQLIEPTARFWSDDELATIIYNGAVDLWGAILDLHQSHYFRIDEDNPVLRANDQYITGVPPDCFRVLLIEPRDTTINGVGHQVLFVPRKYNHTDFIVARTLDAQDPGSLPARQVYYQITGVGAPGEAPRIVTAPKLNSDLALRLVYNPMIDLFDKNGVNPIPGGSDNALKAWTISYARAKETDGRTPDAGWLGIYATEKQLILTRLTPREEQEPEVVDDMFQGYGSVW
jgi:hypothetical protein